MRSQWRAGTGGQTDATFPFGFVQLNGNGAADGFSGAAVDDLADDATVEARLERSCLPLHPMGAGAGWAMGMPTSSGFTFGGNP